MTIEQAFDLLPLTEKTLLKRISKRILPFILKNDGGHPCEWYFKNKDGDDCGMVKYYKGRILSCYGIQGVEFMPV